jgi:hypothetical protein
MFSPSVTLNDKLYFIRIWVWVLIPAMGRDFSVHHLVLTGSGANAVSYPKNSWAFSPESKAMVHVTGVHLHFGPNLRICGALPLQHFTSLWHGD